MTEANKSTESATIETDQEVLRETDEDRLATVEKFYKENYGLGIPDLSLSLTENGLGEALSDLLYKYKLIPEDRELKSFVFPVNFGKDKTLPLVIWLTESESAAQNERSLEAEQLELPLESPQTKYLN